MAHASATSVGRSLSICTACARPFVSPVAMHGIDGTDTYVVELSCANCGRTVVEVHDDATLVALDLELDRATQQMAAAADVLAMASELDRIDRFARALDGDLVLPEDF